ncbi:MAG: ABC transporter ATP-binding protein [Bacteroidales bacterium]|nr:ABC transporter ATP-binding protein [Bacteroidales bacterium]
MKFILHRLKPYGTQSARYVLWVVLSVVFVMATALSVADFLKILFGTDEASLASSPNVIAQWLNELYVWLISFGKLNALLLFSLLVFVLYGLKNLFSYLSAVQMAQIKTLLVADLRSDMMRRVLHLPMRYFDRHRKGDILSRLGTDMVELEESVMNSIQMFMTAVVSIILYLAMLFYLNVKMTLFVLCMLPIIAVVISGISRRLKRNSKEVQERNAYLVSLTDEAIIGQKIIKAYTAIDFSNSRFRKINADYTRKRTAMYRRVDLASPVSDFLGNTIVVSILLVGASLIIGGDQGLTADLFISYIMLFVLMIPPAKDLSTAVSQIKKGRACVDRIKALVDEPEERYGSPNGVPIALDPSAPVIEFRNVSFAYAEGKTVLENVSFSVPRGQTWAIVGGSGSGKTTIASLLCHFYEVERGQVLVNGIDVRDCSLGQLRGMIGVVAQESQLFNGTVKENILFGNPDVPVEQVIQVAKAAQAHDFIMQMPQGYDTSIGEGGCRLSGGQRQRICIARALLCNPQLLLLDEATSALDTEAERQLQQTLDTILLHRTAIVIAHRLTTVRNADNIIVLDGGHIVEQGTHLQLMQQQGKYHELIKLQTIA